MEYQLEFAQPKLSDLKLWRMAKIHSCWIDQHHLPKYWIYHSIIAFRVNFCFTTQWVPIVLVSYMELGPNSDWYTDTVTHAHNHKPDHVHNKVVSKQINMIKWWGWMALAEVCTLWMIFRVSQVAWPETFKLCYHGISVWICPPKLSDFKWWRMAKIHSCWTDQYHLPKYWIHHSIIVCQENFCCTILWVPIVLVSDMEWDPIVTGTLTEWHTHTITNQTMFIIK